MKFLVRKEKGKIKISEGWKKLRERFEDFAVLVIDTNLAIDHALRMAEDGCKVYYYLAELSPFPKLEETITGDGFEEIAKVEDMFEVLDRVDMVVITDSCFPEMAVGIREEYNKLVIGPSKELVEWELDRVAFIEAALEFGIDIPEGEICVGVDELCKYIDSLELKGGEQVWIKISKYRGGIETFSVRTSEEARTMLSQAGFGPYLNEIEFIVQRECKGVEIGCDAFVSGSRIYRPYLYTIEYKGRGNVAVPVRSAGFDVVYDKIVGILDESDYRCNLSFEGFWDGEKYRVIDPTPRFAYPCSSLWAKFIKNYTDVLVAVAKGEDIEVEWEIEKPWYVELTVSTDEPYIWRVIDFSEELRKYLGFRRVVKKNGQYWFVPGDGLVCTVNVAGSSLEKAFEEAKRVTEEIKCMNAQWSSDWMEEAKKAVEELSRLGREFEFVPDV